MKNLVEVFKSKYKVNKKQLPNKQQEQKEKQEQEAARLTLELRMMISVGAQLLKPYKDNVNLVKLENTQIEAIQNVLNSNNGLILNNEFYRQSKEYLQKILDNDCVIELNQEFDSKSKIIEKLAYSLQGKEYWEEKYL